MNVKRDRRLFARVMVGWSFPTKGKTIWWPFMDLHFYSNFNSFNEKAVIISRNSNVNQNVGSFYDINLWIIGMGIGIMFPFLCLFVTLCSSIFNKRLYGWYKIERGTNGFYLNNNGVELLVFFCWKCMGLRLLKGLAWCLACALHLDYIVMSGPHLMHDSNVQLSVTPWMHWVHVWCTYKISQVSWEWGQHHGQ